MTYPFLSVVGDQAGGREHVAATVTGHELDLAATGRSDVIKRCASMEGRFVGGMICVLTSWAEDACGLLRTPTYLVAEWYRMGAVGWSEGSEESAILFRKLTVKTERTASLSRPVSSICCMALGLAGAG